MRYLGGKDGIGDQLAGFLMARLKPDQLYVEPFVGGCSILRRIQGNRIASDISLDLILFYQGLQEGFDPPCILSEDDYKRLKDAEPSALRGFVGYFCSWGGKWFGGFARDKNDLNYAAVARNDAHRLRHQIKGVKFQHASYDVVIDSLPKGSFVYCDPPYAETTEYRDRFDSDKFWVDVHRYSKDHHILVSEYRAPDDFECVLEISRSTNLSCQGNKKEERLEKVFQHPSSPYFLGKTGDLWDSI